MNSGFFKTNREKLIKQLGNGAPVVMVAHGHMQMSRDAEYPFEQDRNFFYLTGINEADWVLVIDEGGEYLIEPKLSQVEKIFNGFVTKSAISKVSGIAEIVEYDEGYKRLQKYKNIRSTQAPKVRVENVFTNPALRVFLEKLNADVEDITEQLQGQRTIKQPQEIEEIKRAIQLTGDAFSSAKSALDELTTEAQLESVFCGHFVANQTRYAYNPIIAAGSNACTLHYTSNNDTLEGQGLVLIDVGAKSSNYAADITRTWQLSGVTKRQREVVSAVKAVFNEALKIIKPGLTFTEYQGYVNEIMVDALGKLGLKNDEENLNKYFPHAPTHSLGLDVHDPLVGYSELAPNMVLTLEPGIYIPEEGIGARYEDDLLITEKSVENLSKDIK